MASRAEKQAIGAISMTAGVYMKLHDHYEHLAGRREIKRLLDQLDGSCKAALGEYNDSLSSKDIIELHHKLEAVETACFADENQEQCPVVLLSLVMGAISDIWDRTANPRRKETLGWLLESSERVLRYYDRKTNRWDSYAVASRGLVVWDREMAK